MTIADLSYLELTEASSVAGSGNSATVYQYAKAAAGNNRGYYNLSKYNTATAADVAYVTQIDDDYYGYYYPYYYHY